MLAELKPGLDERLTPGAQARALDRGGISRSTYALLGYSCVL